MERRPSTRQGERAQRKPVLPTAWSQTSSLQKREEIHACCWSSPVCSQLSEQPDTTAQRQVGSLGWKHPGLCLSRLCSRFEDRDPKFPPWAVRTMISFCPSPLTLSQRSRKSGVGEKAVPGCKTPVLPCAPSQGQGQEGGLSRGREQRQGLSLVTGGASVGRRPGPHFGSISANCS